MLVALPSNLLGSIHNHRERNVLAIAMVFESSSRSDSRRIISPSSYTFGDKYSGFSITHDSIPVDESSLSMSATISKIIR